MSFIKRKIPGVKVSHTGLTKCPSVAKEWHSASRRQAATCAALHVAMKLRPPSSINNMIVLIIPEAQHVGTIVVIG